MKTPPARSPRQYAIIGMLLATVTLISACASTDSAQQQLPGGAEQTEQIFLSSIQPDAGPRPVVNYIDTAKKTLDIYMYEFEGTYAPIVDATTRAKNRGVKVRILLSRREVGQEKTRTNDNHKAAKILNRLGIETKFSRPEFYVSHAKAIIVDSGTTNQSVMICDFNIGSGYFGGASQFPTTGQGGTRGMSVIDTNPADIANIAATFEADWPPYSTGPTPTRPNLIWAPGGERFQPPGNAPRATELLLLEARHSLDIYAQAISETSELVQPTIETANRGVPVRIISNAKGIAPEAATKLRDAGVQLAMQPPDPTQPGTHLFVHSKTVLVDTGYPTAVSMVGSLNIYSNASLYAERELDAFVTDPPSTEEMQRTFDTDFSASPAYAG